MSKHIERTGGRLRVLIGLSLFLPLMLTCPPSASAEELYKEPLFDLAAIQNDPVDVTVLSEETSDGLIVRQLEFTGGLPHDGAAAPERIRGMLLLPERGDRLPGLLWCMGGMAPANTSIPSIYARKGYACIVITLPHDKANAWSAWDAQHPGAANMTRYGHMQMRAVTVLCREPRVDAERIGVAGASYGGFFATLVAGADPRVKAGASFFAAGHHEMGTNLPQFCLMPDRAAVRAWTQTIDPAWRHERRDVPFLWTLPTNDNWFYFPAVAETFARARSQDKVLAIVPYYTHGFPPNVDQQLLDWFDVHLKKTREPYIRPGPLRITTTSEGLRAEWASDGRRMEQAQLVVSPNAPAASESPWLGQWVHRLHQPFAAALSEDGLAASALIPVLDSSRPMLVYGNVTDADGVVTSTGPVLLEPPYPAASPRGPGQWNGCPWGELEPADVATLTAMAQPPGTSDETNPHRGRGSSRVEGGEGAAGKPAQVKLFHVPHLAHRLTLAVRSEPAAKVSVSVEALPPANWKAPAVRAVMGERPAALDQPATAAEAAIDAKPDWQLVTLDVPAPEVAIEGYNLQIRPAAPGAADVWYDSVRFEPVPPAGLTPASAGEPGPNPVSRP